MKEYNKILKANNEFINNDDFPINAIISDFHHLNEKGHLLIYEKIESNNNKTINHINIKIWKTCCENDYRTL